MSLWANETVIIPFTWCFPLLGNDPLKCKYLKIICIESPEPIRYLTTDVSKKLPQSHLLNTALSFSQSRAPLPRPPHLLPNFFWGSSFLPRWGWLWRLVSSAPQECSTQHTPGKGCTLDLIQLSVAVLQALHSSHSLGSCSRALRLCGACFVCGVCWRPYRPGLLLLAPALCASWNSLSY